MISIAELWRNRLKTTDTPMRGPWSLVNNNMAVIPTPVALCDTSRFPTTPTRQGGKAHLSTLSHTLSQPWRNALLETNGLNIHSTLEVADMIITVVVFFFKHPA